MHAKCAGEKAHQAGAESSSSHLTPVTVVRPTSHLPELSDLPQVLAPVLLAALSISAFSCYNREA